MKRRGDGLECQERQQGKKSDGQQWGVIEETVREESSTSKISNEWLPAKQQKTRTRER